MENLLCTKSYHLSIDTIFETISLTPKYKKILNYLDRLNLSYLSLDRTVASLSGGERQRLYLLNQLINTKDKTLFIMENMSFGLSASDLSSLVTFFKSLCLSGHSIFMLDYNDYLVDEVDFVCNFNNLK
jgi:excinuclease ABC subunit A